MNSLSIAKLTSQNNLLTVSEGFTKMFERSKFWSHDCLKGNEGLENDDRTFLNERYVVEYIPS